MTTTFPAPVFDHLLRLTDRRGTLEHARLAEPLPKPGYRTDHAARVLVVATRDHGPDRTLNGLAGVALRFLNDAQALTGACRNRMDSSQHPSAECLWGLMEYRMSVVTPSDGKRRKIAGIGQLGCERTCSTEKGKF